MRLLQKTHFAVSLLASKRHIFLEKATFLTLSFLITTAKNAILACAHNRWTFQAII
jgi:hypothetical protein